MTLNDRQQYQGWILALSGFAHPLRDSLPQPCPGNKIKIGLTCKLYPELQEFWTAHPRESIWFQNRCMFSTQFSGFSICHPMYDEKHMLKVVQHATASTLKNQEATATFLLLPNWMENSTNAFHKTCTDNKDVCTILRNIPKVSHATPLPAKQNTTPASSNIGHAHPSSLGQSCQGATYHKQPILREGETRLITRCYMEIQIRRQFTFPWTSKGKGIAKTG